MDLYAAARGKAAGWCSLTPQPLHGTPARHNQGKRDGRGTRRSLQRDGYSAASTRSSLQHHARICIHMRVRR
eukprot:gene11139-biopygen9626